jgi:hypothetical protein
MGRRTDCLGSLVMHNLNYLRGAFLTSLATAKTLSANERQRVPFEARGFITQTSRAITAGKKLIRHAAWAVRIPSGDRVRAKHGSLVMAPRSVRELFRGVGA